MPDRSQPTVFPPDAEQVRNALRRAAAAVIPDREPNPHAELARQLVQGVTPEVEWRLSIATADILDLIAALGSLAARVERLRAGGRQFKHAPSRDIPKDIPQWEPGNSMNMPGDLGGEFFETSPEAFFWGEVDLEGLRDDLTDAALTLGRDLRDTDVFNLWKRAEELLKRLPAPMLDALRARLAELAAPTRKPKGKRGAK